MLTTLLYYTTTTVFTSYIFLKLTWMWWKRKYNFLPHAPNVPWLGTIPYIGTSTSDFTIAVTGFAKAYNQFYLLWLGPMPVVRIGSAEYAEAVLKGQEPGQKSDLYNGLRPWLTDGLVLAKGKKWKARRTALTPAFHFSILKDFCEVFELHAKQLVEVLQGREGKVVEVQKLCSFSTLDVICACAMGVEMKALSALDSDYLRNVATFKELVTSRMLNPLMKWDALYRLTSNGQKYFQAVDDLHRFTVGVINERIQMRKTSPGSSGDRRKRVLLDTLLDLYESGGIDVDGIREEIDTFMFAGHDTTSAAISWCLYEIGRRPEIQEKLHEEIDSASLQDDISTMEKVNGLKYLESVIKECLRMRNPVPMYARNLERDFEIRGKLVPAGTEVMIEAFIIHMNEKYWNEPEVFRPERFQGEEFATRHPYCYVPFSAGPRNCIGQKFAMLELKTFFYFILSKFRIQSVQSFEELDIRFVGVTHCENGIDIRFQCR